MYWQGNSGKTRFIKELKSLGFSYRRAEKGVNAVFKIISGALAAGDTVETPIGTFALKSRLGRRGPDSSGPEVSPPKSGNIGCTTFIEAGVGARI